MIMQQVGGNVCFITYSMVNVVNFWYSIISIINTHSEALHGEKFGVVLIYLLFSTENIY